MALAESDAPETVRFGAGGDSMRSHPSRGSSPNGGIEEGREKWRGEAAQSGSRLAGFVAVPARFPGRGCASLARSREGVIAGDLGEKVMELEGCKISCWPDYPCNGWLPEGGRIRRVCVWGGFGGARWKAQSLELLCLCKVCYPLPGVCTLEVAFLQKGSYCKVLRF